MGEKQIRTEAQLRATAALQPRFDAVADLAVAAKAVENAGDLRATAQRRAQQILDAAEKEIEDRYATWRAQWNAAIAAGWDRKTLEVALNQKKPPADPKARKRAAATPSGAASPNMSSIAQEPAPDKSETAPPS